MITPAMFRASWPEFGSLAVFPNNVVAYWIAVAGFLLNTNYWGIGSSTAVSPPTTKLDFATELFVAHNLVLEQQAMKAAQSGGTPGTQQGIVTSKSVGSVSLGYDVQSVVNMDGSFWNATTYGTRFLWLARLVGSGPVQIGVGKVPLPFLVFVGWGQDAWAGPWPGIQPSDCGFSS
jgi:Protein of unknown function (DUF4054)